MQTSQAALFEQVLLINKIKHWQAVGAARHVERASLARRQSQFGSRRSARNNGASAGARRLQARRRQPAHEQVFATLNKVKRWQAVEAARHAGRASLARRQSQFGSGWGARNNGASAGARRLQARRRHLAHVQVLKISNKVKHWQVV